ncbi:MAG: hypothetical protein Q4A65_02605 [Bacillota bacterium]|nr:hypothetical protein [Bacillota bacterium]
MSKEKDTTVWKPKGNQKITKPSGPDRRSKGYDAPSSGLGKLSLLIGAGAIIAALARGVRKSDYYRD